MELLFLIKSGFMGYVMAVGCQVLVFFVFGTFLKLPKNRFNKIFLLAAICSFIAVDALLYVKIRTYNLPQAQLFLAGCIGGWLGGLISSYTTVKPYLERMLPDSPDR